MRQPVLTTGFTIFLLLAVANHSPASFEFFSAGIKAVKEIAGITDDAMQFIRKGAKKMLAGKPAPQWQELEAKMKKRFTKAVEIVVKESLIGAASAKFTEFIAQHSSKLAASQDYLASADTMYTTIKPTPQDRGNLVKLSQKADQADTIIINQDAWGGKQLIDDLQTSGYQAEALSWKNLGEPEVLPGSDWSQVNPAADQDIAPDLAELNAMARQGVTNYNKRTANATSQLAQAGQNFDSGVSAAHQQAITANSQPHSPSTPENSAIGSGSWQGKVVWYFKLRFQGQWRGFAHWSKSQIESTRSGVEGTDMVADVGPVCSRTFSSASEAEKWATAVSEGKTVP